jgi:hypothetical protein
VLYYHEGINASVILCTDADNRELWLRVGGKVDASTLDMETQVLLGLLPAALADSGARALVIGHGSGVTTASVLAGGADAFIKELVALLRFVLHPAVISKVAPLPAKRLSVHYEIDLAGHALL